MPKPTITFPDKPMSIEQALEIALKKYNQLEYDLPYERAKAQFITDFEKCEAWKGDQSNIELFYHPIQTFPRYLLRIYYNLRKGYRFVQCWDIVEYKTLDEKSIEIDIQTIEKLMEGFPVGKMLK